MADAVAQALLGSGEQIPLPRPNPKMLAPQWWPPQAKQLWSNMRGSNFDDHDSAMRLMDLLQKYAPPPDPSVPGPPLNILPPGVR